MIKQPKHVKLPEAAKKIESDTGKPFDVDRLLYDGFYGNIAIAVCLKNKYYYLECGEIEKFIGIKPHEEAEVLFIFEDSETAKKSNLEKTTDFLEDELVEFSEVEIANKFESNSRSFCWTGTANDLVISCDDRDNLMRLLSSESVQSNPCDQIDWSNITITLRAHNRISYSYKGTKKYGSKSFYDIGLMGKRSNTPNKQAVVLLGMVLGEKYPTGRVALDADKAVMRRLRVGLKQLLSTTKDPFFPYNKEDGWKPRFQILNGTNAAKDRAKEQAIHVGYDEAMSSTPDFEDEDDPAAQFIRENN